MRVGILTVRLEVSWSRSLKDKRSVLASLRDRIRRRFNVSVIESGLQDNCRMIELSVAAIALSPAYADEILEAVNRFIEMATDAVVFTSIKEIR